MQPNDQNKNDQTAKAATKSAAPGMANPENPAAQAFGPGGIADQEAIRTLSAGGINPQNIDSMSRAEDDELAQQRSLEFHDRLGQGNKAG